MKTNCKDKKSPPIVEYENEQQEFSGIERPPYSVDAGYPYFKRPLLWKIASFFAYRAIMTPFAFLYAKIKFRLKVVNKQAFKRLSKQGYFVYGNHTLMAGDAFFPSLVAFPRKTVVIVNADNLAVPATRWWIELCGALPLPTKISGTRSFLEAVEYAAKKGYGIQIYPEAHIWPYYTGIRRFGSDAFFYPARLLSPVFCTTVTCQQKKHGKTPRVTLFVDGPFYPDPSLSVRERADALQKTVFETMCERAKNSTYQAIHYKKKDTPSVSSASEQTNQSSRKETYPHEQK